MNGRANANVQIRKEDLILAKKMILETGDFLYAWIGEAIREKAERQQQEAEDETKENL